MPPCCNRDLITRKHIIPKLNPKADLITFATTSKLSLVQINNATDCDFDVM